MSGPLTATVDVGGPFKIETEPYRIATQEVLVADEDKDNKTTSPIPAEKPSVAATEEKPETHKTDPVSVTTQTKEIPATEKKGPNWIILTALIGLGVAAAGVAIFKKTV